MDAATAGATQLALSGPAACWRSQGKSDRDGEVRRSCIIDFANLILTGKKAWALLEGQPEDEKPDAWAFVESHLMDEHLNAARRRLKKLGWKTLTTSAVPTATQAFGADEDADFHGEGRKYHKSEGEMLLFSKHLVVHGHHQPKQAVGYRSSQVRFKGWTLHLIVLYLDCNFGLQEGPNRQRTEEVMMLIKCTHLPWIVVGDYNKTPDVVADSEWCRYLKVVS